MRPSPTPPTRTGLTAAEAARRLADDGPNALAQQQRRTIWRVLFEVVREPMFLLLLGAAGLYLVLGDVSEGLTLLGFVLVIIGITVVQEGRTERALDALRDLSSPKATVVRDGERRVISSLEVVRGDTLWIAEGDRVPADALLREGSTVVVDESLLTGESVPVARQPDTATTTLTPPGGEGHASLYAGTLVVGGRGFAEVMATGARSELGRIGASLASLQRGRTRLQREIDVLVRWMAIAGAALAVLLVVIRGVTGTPWIEALLSGIALAMALLPEEFPVVLTVFLALGAWRMTRVNVLTRQTTAVETLGTAQVLCTDKTGTLTENRMTIRRLVPAVDTAASEGVDVGDDDAALPESVHALVEFGILASPREPFDPMEKAFLALGGRALSTTEHLHPDWSAAREFPLSPELLAVTHLWRGDPSGGLVVATKGAPEAIFDLCHLDDATSAHWRAEIEALAARGLRVLGVARSARPVAQVPVHPHDVDFVFLGLVGLEDPVRPEVPAAIALCRSAHIRVLMITGDHTSTARVIAQQAGLKDGDVVTGAELMALDDGALATRLAQTSVVARAVPEHKLRIVQALRKAGRVVAMTGDGVNDAPALKAADIGVAMGKRGTDVAREAASLVLVDDAFGSIVHAVRLGRRIFDNLRKSVGYIVAVHLPLAGLSLLPPLFGHGMVLSPLHVVFLELVIDPTCSVVFESEPEEQDLMQRPPRPASERLLGWRQALRSVTLGLVSLIACLVVAWQARALGHADDVVRTVTFIALVLGNLAILVASRTPGPFWEARWRGHAALPLLCGATLGVLALLVFVPPLRGLFSLAAPPVPLLLAGVVAGVVPVLLVDTVRGLAFRMRKVPA
jgi:Ca2+-transporting ATPase